MAWIDPPPPAHWQQARNLLHRLEVLDADGAITDHGKAVRELGIHPRLAHMVLRGRELGLPELAARLAALLEERDLLGPGAGADLHQRVLVLDANKAPPGVDPARLQAIKRSLSRLRPPGPVTGQQAASAEEVGRLLALAYPDRIARRRSGDAPRYQLSNGRGAVLREDDSLARQDWLVAAELDGKAREATIWLAAAVAPADFGEDLRHLIETRDEAEWDDRRGMVVARRVRRLGELVLEEKALSQVAPELITRGLLNALRDKGLAALPWTNATLQWRARVRCLAAAFPGDWPELTDDWLMDHLDEWLEPFLTGCKRWSEVMKLDLLPPLNALLSYSQQTALNELAPVRLVIPTGQAVTLDYSAENGPVLAAKLQALFGWTDTPKVAGGRVPVVIHLLSPAQRPLAVTADLGNFWLNVYPEVRKEMRGRYPKHPWPEDPLQAEAKQGTKKSGR